MGDVNKEEECPICKKKIKGLPGLRAHLTKGHKIKYEEHRNYSKKLAVWEDENAKYNIQPKLNFDRLLYLTKDIPDGLDPDKRKKQISSKIKEKIFERDDDFCYICGAVNYPQIHHRIPNGEATEDNLFTLCHHCHHVVHRLLYLTGKWKYSHTVKDPVKFWG